MRAQWIAMAASVLAAPYAATQAPDGDEVAALERPVAAKVVPTASAAGLAVPARAAGDDQPTDLFKPHSWYTPPPPPPARPYTPPPAPAEPTAPPLPFVYLGSMQRGNEMVYFLTRGDRAYDVKVGDVLDETYKVDGVSDGRLMFTYLPLATSQGLQIGEPQ